MDRREHVHGRRDADQVSPLSRIEQKQCHQSGELLKHLRSKLERNDLVGLAVVAICKSGVQEIGLSGVAVDHPELAQGSAVRLAYRLLQLSEERMRSQDRKR